MMRSLTIDYGVETFGLSDEGLRRDMTHARRHLSHVYGNTCTRLTGWTCSPSSGRYKSPRLSRQSGVSIN